MYNDRSDFKETNYAIQGFSLIELMIVVVIVGVLSTVAIPAYQEYVIRAKVVNMITMAQPVKLAVTEGLISGSPPSFEKIADQDVVKDISVAENIITITGDSEKLGIKPSDKILKITLTPTTRNQMILWSCQAEPAELKKFAPADCRS